MGSGLGWVGPQKMEGPRGGPYFFRAKKWGSYRGQNGRVWVESAKFGPFCHAGDQLEQVDIYCLLLQIMYILEGIVNFPCKNNIYGGKFFLKYNCNSDGFQLWTPII